MIVLKDNNSISDNINNKYDYYYEIFSDNTPIGYGAIAKSNNDMLYMYLYEEYRGNNYGIKVFDCMVEKIKELGLEKLFIVIDNNNLPMKRIIAHKQNKVVLSGPTFKCYEISI